MLGLHPVADIRAAEEDVMARVPEGSLMARASFGLAVECARLLHEVTGGVAGRRIVVLVGSGNNGGDALFAGAELQRRGAQVIAVPLAMGRHEAGALALLAAGGRLVDTGTVPDQLLAQADLILDGIVGIGASGALRADVASMVARANRADALRVAVDIPSGVDPDSGAVGEETAFNADLTVTFGLAKRGLFAMPGREFTGAVRLIDIGLDEYAGASDWQVLEASDVVPMIGEPRIEDHKYRRGVVGIAAGSQRYPGAAVLTVGGARYAGAGMTCIIDRKDGVAAEVIRAYPEVVSAHDDPRAMGRVRAWVCGPGFVGDHHDVELISAVLECEVPVVLDAGALGALAADHGLRDRVHARHQRGLTTVLTPHAGEHAALFGDRPDAAAAIGAIVVRKGPATVVEDPVGGGFIDTAGTPALATAGSGDVLSGLVGGLLAHNAQIDDEDNSNGITAAQVVAAAVWLHGMAGRCATEVDRPIVAADLIRVMPDVIAGVRRGRLPC